MPGPRNPDHLLQSIPRMEKNIPWRYRWPIVLLHAGMYDAVDNQLDFLSRLRDSRAAGGYSRRRGGGWTDLECRMACLPPHVRVLLLQNLQPSRIRDLTYYLRLDDDSYVREPACFDPFEYMHVNNKSYAFRDSPPDMGWVTEGMWPFVSNYAQRHPEVERTLERNGL
ncbi:hypothetical protein B0H14DRAFT_2868861, partial [Mycena olivaceomarginata]